MCVLVTQSCPTLCDPQDCSPLGSSGPWDFPGQNIGVGCHFFLQGISLIQELNLGLLHCRQIFFLPIELRGKPRRSGQQQIHTRDGKSWDLCFLTCGKAKKCGETRTEGERGVGAMACVGETVVGREAANQRGALVQTVWI